MSRYITEVTLARRRVAWCFERILPVIALSACGEERAVPSSADAGVSSPPDAGTSAPDASATPLPEQVARVCSRDGWCWDGAGPHGNTLYTVAASSPRDIWVAGELGTVLSFDGERWSARWAPTSEHLRSIWVLDSRAWVVGDAATVLYHSGRDWEPVAIPELDPTVQLRAVWGDAEGTLWIAGTRGTLLERRAGEWAQIEVPTAASLNAIWSGGGDVWVVGDGGTVLRHTAGEWRPVDSGTSQNLSAVHGRGQDIWLAGAGGEVRKYDVETNRWQRATGEGPAPRGQLHALRVAAGEQVYVANAEGDLFTWDGAARCPVPGDAGAPEEPCPGWGPARRTGNGLPIFGLWASADLAVAVGANGSIVTWEGDTRSIVAEGSLDNYLDVAGSSADNVWIGGDRLLSSRDGRWEEVTRDSARAVYAIAPLSAERTLIAGTGGMARSYSGDTWDSMDVRPDAWLRGIWSDGEIGWLVGSRGAAWGLLNRRLWTQLTTPTDRDLLDVWSSAEGTAWAVGASGVILRHDGELWAAIPSGPNGGVSVDLRGVWGSAPNDVWAVGTGGTALHWDGKVWTKTTDDAAFSLNDVWGRATDDVWAVGSGGTVLHYDGDHWEPQLSGTAHALNGVWGTGGRLWAVGEHGTILIKELD
jgi:hypothetical protein